MKKISLFLAAVMVLSATACGSAEKDTAPETTQTPGSAEESAAVTESLRAPCNVTKELDFAQAPFRMGAFTWQGYDYYFFANEENGEVMNDALYRRMVSVEEEINVDITSEIRDENCDEFAASMQQIIMSGDDVYDQIFLHCISGVAALSSSGYLYNLEDLPYIDITAEWWNQEQMDVLRLGEKTYFGVNDFMIPCPYVIYFNKDMVNDLGMDNPYDMVYDGTWTLDKFTAMAREATQDLDGNGKWDDTDSYGVTANEISKYISFVTGSNQFVTKRDENGRIALNGNTEKMVSIVDQFLELGKQHVFYIPKSDSVADQLTIDSGRLMFTLASATNAELMRDYSVEFGFLPYPKFDENQDRYYSLDWGGLTAVPSTIKNPEVVGAAIELLTYKSAEEVIPTYYDTVLVGKLARDEDAVKMMDLMFDSVCYEIGGNYFGFASSFGDLFFALPRITVEHTRGDYASWYAKKEKAANKVIADFYDALELSESNS